jgi:NADPH:quinone reductase-like Zn-dependent oxidoreductase
VPRPVLFGNFSLCGVCHAYAENPREFKRATGYNFPSHADGERVHTRILELIREGQVRPIIGSEAAFTDLPAALQSMADRRTVGRVVVRVVQ